MRAMPFLVVALLVAGCQSDQQTAAKSEDAKSVFTEIDAISLPSMNASVTSEEYQKMYEQAWHKRQPLVKRALAELPDDPRTAKVADQYWQSLMRSEMSKAACEAAISEISASRDGSTNAQLRQHAAFWSTFYASYRDREEIDKVLDHAEGFARDFPNDPRGATIYSFASMSGNATREQMERAFETLAVRYATTEDGRFAQAMLPLIDNIGKTFEFDFEDVVTGKRHTNASLKGKVLVIDWWATWCTPCLQAMPKMKSVYAKYKDKGVEFIGVSMDAPEAEGGKKSLVDYVKQNDVKWPQYYLNDDRSFPARYHVSQLPTVFVTDRDGKIVSIDGYRTMERTLESLVGE